MFFFWRVGKVCIVLELLFNVIGCLLGVRLDDFAWPDTTANRIFWGIILVLLGGLIWRELR